MADSMHVVDEDGLAFDVTYEVDEKAAAEKVTVKGLVAPDGEPFEGEVMAPHGRPTVGWPWFAVGDDATGNRLHFHTAAVKSVEELKRAPRGK